MSNVVETVVNNQIENSFTAQVSQLEQSEGDMLVCPGAPKLPSFEGFEGPFLVDDELLAYYNRAPTTSPSLTQPESLEEDDRDTWVCPGAPKLGFSEYCDGLGIMTDEPPICHNYCSPTSLAQLEPHLEDDDRDKLVCPGALNSNTLNSSTVSTSSATSHLVPSTRLFRQSWVRTPMTTMITPEPYSDYFQNQNRSHL